jgi:aspartate aminotransferase-like enzyme
MPGLLPHVDPDGLLEFSVVYTDRALNHMSRKSFQGVMKDISRILKDGVPREVGRAGARQRHLRHGSGGAPVRGDKKVLVIRNGWFSYRWTQIFDMGRIPAESHRAQGPPHRHRQPGALDAGADRRGGGHHPRRRSPTWCLPPMWKPPAGMILPDDYLKAVADAVHEVGGLFVLDCIASGAMWVDMQATGVDVLVSARRRRAGAARPAAPW